VKRTKKSLRGGMSAMVPQTTAPPTQAAGLSLPSCMAGPVYMMRDAWEGSRKTRFMWGSSHAGSESVVGTVRSNYFDSDYQDVSHSGGSDIGRIVGSHGELPLEHVKKNVPKESEIPDENKGKMKDERYQRSPRLANSLGSLRLEANWSPIRFQNRLPALNEENEVVFKGSLISPAEEAPEEDSDEEGDRGLTTLQRKQPRIFPRLLVLKVLLIANSASIWPKTNDHPRIPSPPWRNSMLLEEPRDTTPEPVDPPRKKRRMY
jgi:hypothetical protein